MVVWSTRWPVLPRPHVQEWPHAAHLMLGGPFAACLCGRPSTNPPLTGRILQVGSEACPLFISGIRPMRLVFA